MTGITLLLRFVVIALIYIILFRLIKIMILELKGGSEPQKSYSVKAIGIPKAVGFELGTVFDIKEELTIGRKKNNMIVISDPYVSSYHAVFFIKGDKLYLRDMGSTNGTSFNNREVKEDTSLDSGDIVKIGGLTLRVM